MAGWKQAVKQLLGQLISLFNRREIIIFESLPDFADNTNPVFEEMVKRGMTKRYTMIWSCAKDQSHRPNPEGVRYIYPMSKSLKERIRATYYMACAKCMVCCNRFLVPWTKKQVSFYLSHGTPMKSVRGYYTVPSQIQHCLSSAIGVEDVVAYQFNVNKEKVFSLGFPRNDELVNSAAPVKEMLQTECKKVAVWYPTFRQHNNGLKAGSGKALPIIHDAQAAVALNDFARQMDVLLVLKPHFAQDLTQVLELGLSNIRFIGDDFFSNHNTTSYSFVAGCDALITDYSSIYFDYLVCDKPVGLVWEDLEEYRENPGFAVDIDEYGKGGVKIYTLEDFKNFLQELATDTDSCQEERRILRDRLHYAADGANTQRVTDYIIEKAGL